MKRLLLVFTMLMGVALATGPLVAAQSDVDVDAISEVVLATDPEALLSGLETTIDDADLPAGFSDAELADLGTATAEEGVLPQEDLENTLGSVAYTLGYDPAAAATPEADDAGTPASSTPEFDLSAFSFGFGTLNYVVLEDEIDADAMEQFKEGVEESMEEEGEGNATLTDITIGNADAALITFVLEEQGIQSAVQMVAVPVGNVLVMSMVVQASMTVDVDALQSDAEALAVAGVEHLGTVAEDA